MSKRVYIDKKCKVCPVLFKAYPEKSEHWNRAFKYCSQKCYHLDSRKNPDLVCKRCGITFRPKSRVKKATFCSSLCFFTPPPKNEMARLYLIEKFSIKQISKHFSIGYLTAWNYIHKYQIPVRSELCASFKGGKPYNFIDGRSITQRIKETDKRKYRKWRKRVLTRDGFSCVSCGAKDVTFHADHIKKWAVYPELRYKLSNGQTLCEPCHYAKNKDEGKRYWKNQYSK